MKKKIQHILVTGGAGYIGAHMVRVLLNKGFTPVVLDNLSTGSKVLVPKDVCLVQGDIRKKQDLQKLFKRFSFDAVMHFAALISVEESVQKPKLYYQNNVIGTKNLVDAMLDHGARYLIFSSTASVYGDTRASVVQETQKPCPSNPYGQTKWMAEKMLQEFSQKTDLRYVALRYFNVAGYGYPVFGHSMAKPKTHLIPNVLKAVQQQQPLSIFGSDYPTRDGTCIRDYIHVMDLCEAHYLALRYLFKTKKSNCFNLGTTKGYSVREIVGIAQTVVGRKIKICLKPRRKGDVSRVVASAAKARRVLGWQAKRDVAQMIRSVWGVGK